MAVFLFSSRPAEVAFISCVLQTVDRSAVQIVFKAVFFPFGDQPGNISPAAFLSGVRGVDKVT